MFFFGNMMVLIITMTAQADELKTRLADEEEKNQDWLIFTLMYIDKKKNIHPRQSPQETETLGFETATQFSNGAVKQEAGGS